MPIELTANEARVIGCLMEKSKVTPDQYPLTLNALVNACNQKSSRDPMMALEPGIVQGTIRNLEGKHLVRTEENFKSQVEKYTQRFCNTPFADFEFDSAQFALICVLLLRGPRTPGELKANSGRLHAFADNTEVLEALHSLIDRDGGAVVIELPRTPGRKDPEYMHLLSGPVDITSMPSAPDPVTPLPSTSRAGSDELVARVTSLELEVSELGRQLATLMDPAHDG